MAGTEAKGGMGMKSYWAIWIGLLCIVGIEVFLTYRHWSPHRLLLFLLIFAFIEASIAVMFFMHLKDERPSLFWSLVPALLFVLFMMDHFWPDALRLEHLRVVHW
jgi:heme/copper-type cytochrome/quinol oxidase subunit 4